MSLQPKTVGFKRNERNVFFHILTACNLRCSHCYINKNQHGTEALKSSTIKRWLELFYDSTCQTNLIFLGGEPTLHPDLVDCVEEAKRIGYSVTVDSNGYLFHDFLQKMDPEKLDYLSFSLDGPDSTTNDPIRGEGVYDICVGNLKKAVSLGFRTSLIYTVSSRNILELHRMIPLLQELCVQRFFIQVIGLRGESSKEKAKTQDKHHDQLQVSREQWLGVVPEVARSAAEAGIHVTYPKVFLDINEPFECAGEVAENYFIFPNGRVYQCPLCEDYGLHTYTIEEDELRVNKELNEKMLFSLKIDEGCVMNKLLQPDNLEYDNEGTVLHRVSCCLLKNEIYR